MPSIILRTGSLTKCVNACLHPGNRWEFLNYMAFSLLWCSQKFWWLLFFGAKSFGAYHSDCAGLIKPASCCFSTPSFMSSCVSYLPQYRAYSNSHAPCGKLIWLSIAVVFPGCPSRSALAWSTAQICSWSICSTPRGIVSYETGVLSILKNDLSLLSGNSFYHTGVIHVKTLLTEHVW